MASPRAIAWVEALAWVGIYGGILAIIAGLITGPSYLIAGWSLGVLGGAAIAAGCVLIYVRSRMSAPGGGGAQSNSTKEGTP